VWSPDDSCVVSGAADQTVRIWNAKTGTANRLLTGHTGIVLSCEISTNGDYIVSNDEKYIKIWDFLTGECVNTLDVAKASSSTNHGKPSKKLAWTLCSYCPGVCGYYVIGVANDKMVTIFDPFTGSEILSLCCKFPVYCLTAGPKSKVAFGDSCGNVYIVEFT
jgi:WD40 repeat protein